MARLVNVRPAVLLAAAAAALAVVASSAAGEMLAGPWRHVPPAPFALQAGVTSVWTGHDVVVTGLTARVGQAGFVNATENAAAYNPSSNTWRALAKAPATPSYCRRDAVWTGSQMLVWGCRATTYDPSVNRWRRLPDAPTGHGFAVWTGRELIGWGGGCCGDAGADGSAYEPMTNRWRKLPRAPLAPEQSPLAAWDGHELLVFVSGISAVNGRPLSPDLARGAAYDPAANRWRVLQKRPVAGGAGVWDGSELIVVGAGRSGRVTEAFDPVANRWRRLASAPAGRLGGVPVWTGSQVIVWGGHADLTGATIPRHALAFEPRTNRWTSLTKAPMRPRESSQVAWTGRRLVVLGGVVPTAKGRSNAPTYLKDGAAFTPAGL